MPADGLARLGAPADAGQPPFAGWRCSAAQGAPHPGVSSTPPVDYPTKPAPVGNRKPVREVQAASSTSTIALRLVHLPKGTADTAADVLGFLPPRPAVRLPASPIGSRADLRPRVSLITGTPGASGPRSIAGSGIAMIGAKHAQMGPGRFLRHLAASTATRSERIRQPDPRPPFSPRGSPSARQAAKRLHPWERSPSSRRPPLPTSPVG